MPQPQPGQPQQGTPQHCKHCLGACPGDCLIAGTGRCLHGWNDRPPRQFSWQLVLTRKWWRRVLWGGQYTGGA